MKQNQQGTMVVYYNTGEEVYKSISIDDLDSEQQQCFQQLDKEVQQDILDGRSINVYDNATESKVCEFNHKDVCLPDSIIESLARAALPSIQEFYSHKENEKAFQQWLTENKK